jgi:hypothetical protein
LCRRDVCRSTRSRGGVFGRLEARRTRVGAESEWSIELRSFLCSGVGCGTRNREPSPESSPRESPAPVLGTQPRGDLRDRPGSAPAPSSRVGGTYDDASPGGGRGAKRWAFRALSRGSSSPPPRPPARRPP